MTEKILQNAPIIEAVLDIRLVDTHRLEAQDLKIDLLKFQGSYSSCEQIRFVETEFKLAETPQVNTIEREFGYRYLNEDKTEILQLRIDGFTLNVLKPYSNWSDFLKKGIDGWNLFKSLGASNKHIERLGLRYINLIEPQNECFKVDSPFLFNHNLNPDGPMGKVKSLSLSVESNFEKECLQSIVSITSKKNPISPFDSIFDIDIGFNAANIEIDDAEIVKKFNLMREIKNKIFFGSLSAKLIEEYN